MFYGKLPILLLAEVSSQSMNSTNSQIAAYLLEHLDEVRNTSIKELARKCFVSPSSISRFCRDMGLNDFAELRELISETDLKFEVGSQAEDSEKQKKDYVDQVLEGISRVGNSLDMVQVEKLVNDIHMHKKVSVFGLLKAETVAMNLQTDLQMLGKQVNSKVHFSQQIEYLEQADEEYSQNRIHPNIKRPKIYFITGNPYVKKNAFLNEVIHFSSRQNQPSHPYQLQVAADIIAQAYAHYRLKQFQDKKEI